MPLHLVGKGKSLDNTNFTKREEKIIRQIHISLLAKPAPVRLKPWPNPEVYREFPWQIPSSVLNYHPTKRINLLSQPMSRFISKRYSPVIPSEHFVEPSCLSYVPSPRLLELAEPRVMESKTLRKKKSAKELKREKLFRKRRTKWLALRAVPRKPKTPTAPKKSKKDAEKSKKKKKAPKYTEEEIMQRIEALSKPCKVYRKISWDPYAVSPQAQRYQASQRILLLSTPRPLHEETLLDMTYNPYVISPTALNYKPTENIVKMAAPHVRTKQVDTDVKEDPFSVPRRALKAKCSARLKELAKPVERG